MEDPEIYSLPEFENLKLLVAISAGFAANPEYSAYTAENLACEAVEVLLALKSRIKDEPDL